jgi:hypothetical protein
MILRNEKKGLILRIISFGSTLYLLLARVTQKRTILERLIILFIMHLRDYKGSAQATLNSPPPPLRSNVYSCFTLLDKKPKAGT